jgi:hypothetical protein
MAFAICKTILSQTNKLSYLQLDIDSFDRGTQKSSEVAALYQSIFATFTSPTTTRMLNELPVFVCRSSLNQEDLFMEITQHCHQLSCIEIQNITRYSDWSKSIENLIASQKCLCQAKYEASQPLLLQIFI